MDEIVENPKELTWRELKDFINALPEEQLDATVIYWGEEEGGVIGSALPNHT